MKRFIVVLALLTLFAASSAQSVNVDTAGGTWTYIVSNNTVPEAWQSFRSFTLPIFGPVSNIVVEGDDHGWLSETDGATYVRWYNPDEGGSIDNIDSGEFMVFRIDSPFNLEKQVVSSLTTWDGWIGSEGIAFADTVSPVPEPATLVALTAGAILLIRRRRRRA